MSSIDVGIDLGTANIIISTEKGIILREPSVVAYNKKTEKVVAVGQEAFDMLGRTPGYIVAIRPLRDGVISDHNMTDIMISEFIKKVTGKQIVKPKIVLCIPAEITDVESRAVVEAALEAGARKVYLIQEPIAAMLGAGIDITKPSGSLVVDIGGGTTDIAVISMGGIVKSKSLKVAGNTIDEAIMKYMLRKYKLLLGDKTSERAKIELADVYSPSADKTICVKGRNVVKGLPEKISISQMDIKDAVIDCVNQIVESIKSVLEISPPELVGDIYSSGITLTGGTALLGGLDKYIAEKVKVKCVVADDPLTCVAKGTIKSFKLQDKLLEGFQSVSLYKYK